MRDEFKLLKILQEKEVSIDGKEKIGQLIRNSSNPDKMRRELLTRIGTENREDMILKIAEETANSMT